MDLAEIHGSKYDSDGNYLRGYPDMGLSFSVSPQTVGWKKAVMDRRDRKLSLAQAAE